MSAHESAWASAAWAVAAVAAIALLMWGCVALDENWHDQKTVDACKSIESDAARAECIGDVG